MESECHLLAREHILAALYLLTFKNENIPCEYIFVFILRCRTIVELRTIVGIEVNVSACLRHSVAGYFEQKETSGVRVNDIDEHGIGWIEANLRAHALEVRFGWVESSDATNARNSFSCIRGSMCSKRMAD